MGTLILPDEKTVLSSIQLESGHHKVWVDKAILVDGGKMRIIELFYVLCTETVFFILIPQT